MAAARTQASGLDDGRDGIPAALAPGSTVMLRRPWRLRGARALVRRRVTGGWEVEVRTPLGTPMHLVVPRRALRRV